jgi:membrane fusion protein, adhesin transport system
MGIDIRVANANSARRMLILGGLGLVALIIWAFFGRLAMVSNAVGQVVPRTRVKAVQHLEGGIIADILVEEGEHVVKDQALVRLDPVKTSSELDELSARLVGLQIDIHRLSAELEGAEKIDLPPALVARAPQLAISAQALFESRKRRLANDLYIQKSLIEQRQQRLRELEIGTANSRKALELISAQVDISDNLMKKELTNRLQHLELLRQQQALRGQLEADQAAMPRIEAALRESQEQLKLIRETFLGEARQEFVEVERSNDELSQRLLKYRYAKERIVLRSPVDGIVKTLAVATSGGVIQPGQTVVEIVPLGVELVIEARLPLQDIGYVHPGQSVRVTLNSPIARDYGHIDGTVDAISPDASVDEEGRAFYRVRVVTTRSRFEMGGHAYQLYPGMEVLCSILVGTRTVAEYLLGPWFRSMRFAFQER